MADVNRTKAPHAFTFELYLVHDVVCRLREVGYTATIDAVNEAESTGTITVNRAER